MTEDELKALVTREAKALNRVDSIVLLVFGMAIGILLAMVLWGLTR